MKVLVFITAIVSSVTAKPTSVNTPPVNSDVLAPAGIPSQYHVQDVPGQYEYAYGYTDGISSKQELKTLDGVTRGSYTYVDAKGDLQTVDYIADSINGFQASGTNLPKVVPNPEPVLPDPVTDTPEVLRAKELHFAAFLQEAKLRETEPTDDLDDDVQIDGLAEQVKNTPEVAKTKAEPFATKKETEIRNALVNDIKVNLEFPATDADDSGSGILSAVKTEKKPSKVVYTVCTPVWNYNILPVSGVL